MNTLFKAIVGSQAYGTNTPESDLDIKGIYQQSLNELLGYYYQPQIEVSKDEVYFEIKRFLELAETANPTILEILYSPEDCILVKDPILNILFENRDKFLTKKCKDSFGGYAVQQIKKARGLNKKQNWEHSRVERKEPIDFCYVVLDQLSSTIINRPKQGVQSLRQWLKEREIAENQVYLNKLNHTEEGYQLYHGDGGIMTKDNSRLKTISSSMFARPIATVLHNANAFKQHKRDYQSYELWLKERNTARYVDFQKHGQSYDGKNLLHCRRLIDMAIEIASERTINVRRPNVDYLLSIRRGEVKLEDIIKQAEEDIIRMDELFEKSDLPKEINSKIKEELLLKIRGL